MKQANRKYCVKAEDACKKLTKTEIEVVTDLLAYESVFSRAVNDATKENKAVLLQMMRLAYAMGTVCKADLDAAEAVRLANATERKNKKQDSDQN
jgi:hypothetical protein